MTTKRFKTGSGCYVCRVCGKRTRETGAGESSCELCLRCYEWAGIENHHSDCCSVHPDPACPICMGVTEKTFVL